MKKSLFAFLASLAFGIISVNAQDAAPATADIAPAEEAEKTMTVVLDDNQAEEPAAAPVAPAVEPAAPALPSLDLDAIFAAVPENVVTAGDQVLVTRAQIVETVRPVIENAMAQGAPIQAANVNNFIQQVAYGMGVQKVLLSNAQKEGFTGDVAAAKERLDQIKAAIAEQAGPDAFAQELKAMGKTEDELLQMFVEEDLIQEYSKKLDTELTSKVADPTEEELKKFYDENADGMKKPASYSAAHILVQFPSQTPTDEEKAAALAKIVEIKGKIAADGSNFGDLAKEFSDCPSKAQGGDLGQFPKGAMVQEFEDALATMKEGEISEPVETMFGYHLIKAGVCTPEQIVTFDEAKGQIKDYLKSIATEKAARAQLDEILKSAAMTVNLPGFQPPTME